jgi:hypothetical protein
LEWYDSFNFLEKHINRMNTLKYLILISIFLLLLAGCSGAGEDESIAGINPAGDLASAQPTADATTFSQPAPSEVPAQTSIPAQPPQATVEAANPAEEAGGDNSAPAAPTMPTPRPDLEATNPGDVRLASGRVQLIEFFAFW